MLRNFGQMCLKACHLSTCIVAAGRHLPRHKYIPRDNSGIHRRLKLIAKDEPDIQNAGIDLQSMEDLEQDFMLAADLNDETMQEIKKIAWERRLKITERKYFRAPKEPSLLTWSEKQQIIHLHEQDQEKWSPEVLAESFPASPAIIKKILRAKWKPLTKERLIEHDRRVSENWVAFHRGELKVHDPKLKVHLEKFTDRKDGIRIIFDEDAARITEITLPKPKKTEFLSLVTTFIPNSENKLTEIENKRLQDNIQPPKQIGQMNPSNIVDKSGAYYTLDQYREKLSGQLNKDLEDCEEIKAIINSGNKNNSKESLAFESYVAPSESFKSDAVVHQKREKSKLQLFNHNDSPDKITIPEDQWKPGLVYKVKDCFYNDKGHFLYRVPGLKAE